MKLLRLIGNVLWFVTIGLSLFLGEIIAGIFSILTIIPLFFGIPWVHFRNATFVIAPFGKKVKTHFFKAPIRNVISFIFGGFVSGLAAFVAGILLCITIIGIPLGKVLFGVAKLTLAPFHAEISKK